VLGLWGDLKARVFETDDDLAGVAILEPFLRRLKPRIDDSITLAGRPSGAAQR